MRAQFEFTEGKKRLQKIIDEFPPDSPHWNEAQNRFQFVDRLLIECLGWQKPDIEVEAFDGTGRADYLMGRPVKAVLEAKREATRFESMPTGSPTIVRSLEPLIHSSRALSDAVTQVIQYCALRGASIAIICNGDQLVIFQAIIPGSSPLNGECYFFNGFSSYIENFKLLWRFLSPEGITENTAFRELSLHRNPRVPPKASHAIPEPNKYRYRNTFQENLRSISSLLLEEIEDNPELKSDFYKECYVPIDANNRNLLLSKKLIASRYARTSESNIPTEKIDSVASTDEDGNVAIDDLNILGLNGSRPIVVIGDVGVGKTSFFENLFENIKSSDNVDSIFIHINLGLNANLSSNIKSFVLSEVPEIMRKHYGIDIFSSAFVNTIYYRDLERFDNSPKGQLKDVNHDAYLEEKINYLTSLTNDLDRHLKASFGYLSRGQNKKIVMILDNADQRTFSVQQETFLIAQELASSRNLIVFVALRPSTFYLSKESGALAAYQNKILTISPPPADEVVERRLIFATRVAEGKVDPANLTGIRLNLINVVAFLKATLRSIRDNQEIRQFLSNITGGNTRVVIELITSFFGSPNVDSKKIVDIEIADGNYKIPLHEFTKHSLLGEYAYFNSQSSVIACNIFDVKYADPREHFLASIIIAFLSSNTSSVDKDGFCIGGDINIEMIKYGFVEDQVRHSLRTLAQKKLIETPHAHFREIAVDDSASTDTFHFRATSVGIYHTRYWTGSFAFLDAVSTDTPIFEQEARDKISRLAPSLEIKERFEKADLFRKYLKDQWHLSNITTNYYDFDALLRSQEQSFVSVRNFLEKGPKKREFNKRQSRRR